MGKEKMREWASRTPDPEGTRGETGIVKLMDDRGNAQPLFFFAGERRGEAPYWEAAAWAGPL